MTGRIEFDVPEATYHSLPSLSSTGARRLLESPARFRYMQDHPQPPKDAFDLGTAVHAKVLGVGMPTVAIPDDLLASNGAASTAAAKAWISEQREAGTTPVKASVAKQVDAMAESVLAHAEARALFSQSGNSESTVFATDPDTGVDMRARFDYLPDFTVSDPWTVDLKTTARTADEDGFSKVAGEHRYDIQQEWYLHCYALATGDFTARMKFVVVETNAPYLVGVHSLASEFAELGRKQVRRALERFAACTAADAWPGYRTNPDPIQPPTWLMFQEGAIS